MSLTFRTKLLLIVGVAGFAFILIIATGAFMGKRVERQLATIHGSQVPKLELGPQLDGQFERLRRGFQDAVASRDADNLAATQALKERLLQRLDAAKGAVDPTDADALRKALDGYCDEAGNVSARLIAGETGESLLLSVADMQAKQVEVDRAIEKVSALDRRELAGAFAAAVDAERSATSYEFVISVACLVSVLSLAFALSGGALRTLTELTRGLARFGTGDFSQPIRVTAHDELGKLAQHANQMAASLQALGRQRDQAEGALKLSNRELEAFSYSVAHDLRAPLRGINGFSRALLEDSGDKLDEEGRDHLRRIEAGARRMGELIDALLTLSRVTRVELHGEVVDLSSVAQTVVKQLQASDPERAVDLVSPARLLAHGDPRLLRAVMENLLGNAWKFTRTRAPAKIEFGAERNGDGLVYFVRDNGAGFDMAYSGKLFAPFQRLHDATDFGGTGIGLATVQRIIDRHGGKIWAEGTVDRGATFFFTLPERQAARQQV